MLLLLIFIVVLALTEIPTSLTLAALPTIVVERLLMVFELIFTKLETFVLAKPVTTPPVPLEFKLFIALLVIFSVLAEPLAPMVIAVIANCPFRLETVLFETEEVPPKPVTVNPVIGAAPVVQLLNIFPVNVLVDVPASVCTQPAIVAAPVNVIFEKLLVVWVTVTPAATVAAVLVNNVTVPPVPLLLNPVTMLLPLTI
jgi:hypothetical protein